MDFLLALQYLTEFLRHFIPDFFCRTRTFDIRRTYARLHSPLDGLLNGPGFILQVERILQHHCHRKDHGDRIHDAFSEYVWSAAVDWLVKSIAFRTFSIGDAGQACAGEEAERANEHAGFV